MIKKLKVILYKTSGSYRLRTLINTYIFQDGDEFIFQDGNNYIF